jgi:CheY-like chemotaxis protein
VSLTRQLLAFSRKQIGVPRLLDLSTAVQGMEKMLRRMIGEDIELKTVLQPVPVTISADPGEIDQVLLNLAVNAKDAMPNGGTLSIETRNVVIDGVDYAVLVLSDTGTGMDDSVMAHLFEPFFTTKGVGGGTGLGLSVVLGIVEQSRGHIEVESEVGKGATFKLYFPAASLKKADTGPIDPSMPHGDETILLVEDETTVRQLARHILEPCGYRILEAGSGQEAIQLIQGTTEQIHLVVTDVVMPNLGGRALWEFLKKAKPDTRVLFVSGYTDDTVVRYGILQSELPFLQKPFSAIELAQKVREVLDQR